MPNVFIRKANHTLNQHFDRMHHGMIGMQDSGKLIGNLAGFFFVVVVVCECHPTND